MKGDTATKAWPGDDFPGWLSPMLVRELRQGLQSGGFAWTFVALQTAMCLLMIWSTFAAGDPAARQAARAGDGFFWFASAVGIAIAVPLRGLAALSGERIGNNLDLVRLTRLSATRIVVGKWLANVAQALLAATSILPYVVLRYFLGGVNVLRDLESFGWICVAALVVAAAALALSTLPEGARRATAVLASFGCLLAFVFFLEGGLARAFGFFDPRAKLGILALAAVYTVAFLEYAAAEIAPPAENHAVRKRGIATLLVLAWLVAAAVGSATTGGVTIMFTAPLVIGTAIGALIELPVPFRSSAARFARFGPPGRIAARFLMPGWATAIPWIFAVAALGGTAIRLWGMRHAATWQHANVLTAIGLLVVASLLAPLPALAFLPRVKQRFAVYLLVELFCVVCWVIARSVKPHNIPWSQWSAGWGPLLLLPPSALLSFGGFDAAVRGALAPLFAICAAGIVAALVGGVAAPWLREQRALGRLLAERGSRPPPGTSA
jgi:hypothetical protein